MQADEAIRLIEEAIAKCEKGSGGTPPPAEEPPPEYPGLDGPYDATIIVMPPGEEGP